MSDSTALLFDAQLSMHSQLILYVHQASQRAESSSICNFKCEHSLHPARRRDQRNNGGAPSEPYPYWILGAAG